MKLSIIIPVFNEEKTVAKTIKRVINTKMPVTKEIIVVNDGSTDATLEKLKKIKSSFKNIKVISHKKNLGKGSAIKTAAKKVTGNYILIQDADLEYHPKYITNLLEPILNGKAKVVYGTRIDRAPHLKGEENTFQFLTHYFGNRLLSLLTSVLYGQWITDMETGYKLFPKKVLFKIKLKAKGFEFEPEITAKLSKLGYRIKEVKITTVPRHYEEGKKINTLKDGLKAVCYLFKYRFQN